MTDEVVETQAPKRRITDPAEALAALERALPGLAAHRAGGDPPPSTGG